MWTGKIMKIYWVVQSFSNQNFLVESEILALQALGG